MSKPKTCKFKKISSSMPLYVASGYVSNGHWLFKTDWLMGIKRERSSGIIGLQNKITKAIVKNTTDKLSGLEDKNPPDVKGVVERVNLDEYRALNMARVEWVTGYFKGNPDDRTSVSMAFSQKGTPTLDIEYSAMLFFDPMAMPMFKDAKSPVIVVMFNEVVAMLMPLRPQK